MGVSLACCCSSVSERGPVNRLRGGFCQVWYCIIPWQPAEGRVSFQTRFLHPAIRMYVFKHIYIPEHCCLLELVKNYGMKSRVSIIFTKFSSFFLLDFEGVEKTSLLFLSALEEESQ